jgi:hypothetical protein
MAVRSAATTGWVKHHFTDRAVQVLLAYYKDLRDKGRSLPPNAAALLAETTGTAARSPPSWEDQVRQLAADENTKEDGKPSWSSHVDHVEVLNYRSTT